MTPGPAPAPSLPTRRELAERTVEILNRGNRRNPDVLLVADGDRRLVVKDFAPRGPLVRATLGRWLTAREAAAYRRLEGHPAVPRFLGFVDPLAFAVEFRPGRRVSRHLIDDAGPDFVDALEAAVRGLHERGLVHLDLGHRSNVLIDDAGAPVLIDFASALWFRPGGWAARRLLPRLAAIDRRAVAKYRAKLERQRRMRRARQAPSEDAGVGAAVSGTSEPGRRESRPT
jgi:predicted Ser/Thr protein kinase